VPEDPYSDPVTGVLHNKLGLRSAVALEAAEREITHAALIFLDESPLPPPAMTCLIYKGSISGSSAIFTSGRGESGR
jgi:hypothetical protein